MIKPSPYLISRRRAAYALNQFVKTIGLGAMAEHFDPEQPDEWDNRGENYVLAMRNGTVIAEIDVLGGGKVHMVIPRWDGLIRTEHLNSFDPAVHGLHLNNSMDVFRIEKFPDSEGDFQCGDPPGLDLPPAPTMRRTRAMPITVVM